MAEQGSGPTSAAVARITLVVVGVLVLVYGLFLLRQILVLTVVALFLAIGLDPLVRFLMRLRLPRPAAVAGVFAIASLVLITFLVSLTPPVVRQTQRLAVNIPQYAQSLSERSDRFREIDEQFSISERARGVLQDAPNILIRSVDEALGVFATVGRIVFSVVTVTILTVYFMLDLPRLISGGALLVPSSRRERTQRLSEVVFSRISGYIMGQLAVSLIAGITSAIALTILGVPYALPLAIWVGLAALIPMVGATVGAIPAVIVAFLSSFWTGLGAVIFFLVYQQFENYVVAPRVMRRAVDISPAAVILAALVGATLLGFVGALLAIPMAASLKVIGQEVWIPRQESA